MTVVDFTDVEERSFEPVPRGQYLVEVAEAEEREGQESGIPYLNLELGVSEGDFAERKIWDILSYSPGALWKLKQFLGVAGYNEEDLAGEFEVDPDEFVGMEFLVSVSIRKDRNGNDQNTVSRYSPA